MARSVGQNQQPERRWRVESREEVFTSHALCPVINVPTQPAADRGRGGQTRAPQCKQQTTASLYLCSSGLHQRAGISQEATGFTLYCRELKGLKKHRSERKTGLMEPQTHLLRLHTCRMSSAEAYTQPLLPMCCSSFSLCSYMYVRVGLKEARCQILIGL